MSDPSGASRREIASPMPLVPPVTRATRSRTSLPFALLACDRCSVDVMCSPFTGRWPPSCYFSLLLRIRPSELRLERRNHRGIAEGRDVAQLAAFRYVAQQAAHDLARPRLRQVVCERDLLRPGELADAPGDMLAQFCFQS